MILKVNGIRRVHEEFQLEGAVVVDATTDELYISFEMEGGSKKQRVFAVGRNKLLKAGFQPKKFRFVDDILFSRKIIDGRFIPAVTVKVVYKGSWKDVK